MRWIRRELERGPWWRWATGLVAMVLVILSQLLQASYDGLTVALVTGGSVIAAIDVVGLAVTLRRRSADRAERERPC